MDTIQPKDLPPTPRHAPSPPRGPPRRDDQPPTPDKLHAACAPPADEAVLHDEPRKVEGA